MFQATDVRVSSVEFNAEFVSKMIPRLDYKVLWQAANTLGYSEGLPPNEPVENYDNNEDFLKKLHHVLLEVDVITGELICPETGRKFPITKGIPNMLLTEAEV